ncbi:Nicotine blue oxidoreductase [Baekduia alba]|uniref:nucleotidyltransferase family protein n=1 Tax=Baekduia alba TaxID=2997333 RepID=UPI0023410213|nr:nucleotidyltransferase family protein [Baekduia alba]WCB94615.1 Nicotine blue oxidoreductase [Baekduia alba]
MGVTGVVLAAGAGSRFGGDLPKPLVPFRGRPLVTWPLAALREGGVEDVVVVLGARADAVAAGADLGGAAVAVCPAWEEGLSASLRCGVEAAVERDAEAVVVVLGDQPLLRGAAVAAVVQARAPAEALAVRATYGGVPGHPSVIESALFTAVAELRGDTGARELLRGAAYVRCDGLGSPADADTPEALARLAALG